MKINTILLFISILLGVFSYAQETITQEYCQNEDVILKHEFPINGSLQWQISEDLVNWVDLPGQTADSIIVTLEESDISYRLEIIDNTCNPVYSTVVTLKVFDAPLITQQPETVFYCLEDDEQDISFQVVAEGEGINYQWQYFNDNIEEWENVEEGIDFNGVNSSLLSLNEAANFNGKKFRCVVTDVCNNKIITDEVTVSYSSTPQLGGEILGEAIICEGSEAIEYTLSAETDNDWVYNWVFNNEEAITTNEPSFLLSNISESGVLSVYASTICGNSETLELEINVLPTPQNVEANTNKNLLCEGDTLYFFGSGDYVDNWQWTGPPAFSSTQQNAFKLLGPPGIGVYALTASNACGSITVETEFIDLLKTPQNVSATTPKNPICEGDTLFLHGNGEFVNNWQWTGPPAFNSTQQNAFKLLGPPGIGVYALTASNACGSITVETEFIDLLKTPQNVSATTPKNPICEGDTLFLHGNGEFVDNWQWSGPPAFNSTQQNTFKLIGPPGEGVYTVTASNECGETSASTAFIVVAPKPSNVSIEATSTTVQEGESVTLNGLADHVIAWQWDGPNNFFSDQQTITITNFSANNVGTYTLTAWNQCGGTITTVELSMEGQSTEGRIFYVSSSEGSNSNSGLSPQTPWATFDNLRNLALVPGDTVLLKRGDSWNSRLTILGKGSEANPIYIGPYGDINDPAPIISLTNHRDDIAIVVQDLWNNATGIIGPYNAGLGHIHINNLDIRNTRMGIYFRNVLGSEPVGFKVTNCRFENIYQEDVQHNIGRRFTGQDLDPVSNPSYEFVELDENYISKWRRKSDNTIFQYLPDPTTTRFNPSIPTNDLCFFDGQADYESRIVKGNLDSFGMNANPSGYSAEGGGSGEYIFPAAIFFSGRRGNNDPRIGFKDIDVNNILLINVFFGIGGDFLFRGDTDLKFYENIRVTDVTMYSGQTILGFTNANYGNPLQNPNNHWGVFKNLNTESGNADFLFAGGTTGGFAERTASGIFIDCNFSNVHNGGINPPAGYQVTADGCGFDFEGGTSNITIQNSIFANNTGQGVLIMQGNRPPNANITLVNNLFYNNLLSAMDGNNYRWDITVWNDDNTNVNFTNNRHVHRNQTDGGVRPNNFINRVPNQNNNGGNSRSYGFKQYAGLSESNASFRNDNNLGSFRSPDFMNEVSNKGLMPALNVVTLIQSSY